MRCPWFFGRYLFITALIGFKNLSNNRKSSVIISALPVIS
jgi:hypothetical protein